MIECARGGFGAIQAKTLEVARTITMKRFFTYYERKELGCNEIDWNTFHMAAFLEQEDKDFDEWESVRNMRKTNYFFKEIPDEFITSVSVFPHLNFYFLFDMFLFCISGISNFRLLKF